MQRRLEPLKQSFSADEIAKSWKQSGPNCNLSNKLCEYEEVHLIRSRQGFKTSATSSTLPHKILNNFYIACAEPELLSDCLRGFNANPLISALSHIFPRKFSYRADRDNSNWCPDLNKVTLRVISSSFSHFFVTKKTVLTIQNVSVVVVLIIYNTVDITNYGDFRIRQTGVENGTSVWHRGLEDPR